MMMSKTYESEMLAGRKPRYVAYENHPHGWEIMDTLTVPVATFVVGMTEENAKSLATKLSAEDVYDSAAVDLFAHGMKTKLAITRRQGRYGWRDADPKSLSKILHDAVDKGDPRDVANLCMMLSHLGQPISPPERKDQPVAQWQYRVVLSPGDVGPWHNCSPETAAKLQSSKYPEENDVRALYADRVPHFSAEQRSCLESLARTSTPAEQEVLRSILDQF